MKLHRTIRAVKRGAAAVCALSMIGCSGSRSLPSSPDPVVGHATDALGAAVQIFETGWQPTSGSAFNPCSTPAEVVTETGQFSVRLSLIGDGHGGIHATTTFGLRLQGVGDTTGAKYVTVDPASIVENDFSSGAVDFSLMFMDHLVKQGDGAGSFFVHSNLHLTIGADGVLRSDVEHFFDRCG
jgi:hypothetical protein